MRTAADLRDDESMKIPFTAHLGKWHFGSNFLYRPIDRGFDEWLGQDDGGTGMVSSV